MDRNFLTEFIPEKEYILHRIPPPKFQMDNAERDLNHRYKYFRASVNNKESVKNLN